MKTITKTVLMLPIPFFLFFGGYYLIRGGTAGDLSTFMAAFTSVYVPALSAFVVGTSIKRRQQGVPNERGNLQP
jgi:hypothetical protein